MRRIGVLMCFLACVLIDGAGQESGGYQLIGKIRLTDQEFTRSTIPTVILEGTRIPFAAETRANLSGQFKFKNLYPDLFTLIVYVPRAGQHQQTVEVSPRLADSRKRIHVEVLFQPNLQSKMLRQISSSQLSIPQKAQKEYAKAREKLGRRDSAAAIAHLKKAVALAPQFLEAWNHLGTLANASGDFKLAENYFREALKHDSDYYPSLVNLGGVLLTQGMLGEALPINLAAVQAMPDDALAHSQLGLSYYFLGKSTEAEKSLQMAVSLDAGHFSYPQLPLADLYLRKKDFASAARALEQFVELHPDAEQAAAARKELERIRANWIRDSRFEIRD
jgi:tetratricopeptide (TPR) repeat protein